MSSPSMVDRIFDECEAELEFISPFDEQFVETSVRELEHCGPYLTTPAPVVQPTKHSTPDVGRRSSYFSTPAVQSTLDWTTKPLPRRVTLLRRQR